MQQTVHTLKVKRDVLNIPKKLHRRLTTIATSSRGADVQICYPFHAALINPGELKAVYRNLGVVPTQARCRALADYIDERLPDSAYDPLSLAINPIMIYRKPRKGYFLAMACDAAPILQERESIQETTAAFLLNQSGVVSPRASMWKNGNHRLSYVTLARCGTLPNLELFKQRVTEEAILPAHLELEYVTIDQL